jgi:hypothetical protein
MRQDLSRSKYPSNRVRDTKNRTKVLFSTYFQPTFSARRTQSATPKSWARTSGPMLGDGHFQRGELADKRIRDPRRELPVDHALWQMPQEIDDAGMGGLVARRHELGEQPLDARADALEAARRSEEGG